MRSTVRTAPRDTACSAPDRRARSFLVGALLALASGCGGPALCARSSECAPGLVCGLSGSCAQLRSPDGARFSGSRWLLARDWGVAGAPGRLDDELPAGDGLESLLAFGPLPEGSEILRALLVLHPHDRMTSLTAPVEVVVEHVEPFRGGPLPSRSSTQPLRFAAGRRLVPAGARLPVRVDVSDAARSAAGRDDRRLYLLVRVDDGPPSPVVFASPYAGQPSARPRLELLVH